MFKVNGESVASIKDGGQGKRSWKSDAFLNFYLPSKDGGRKKIGFIGLKKSDPVARQLIEFLQDNPEARVSELLTKLEVDFKLANGGEGSVLDL